MLLDGGPELFTARQFDVAFVDYFDFLLLNNFNITDKIWQQIRFVILRFGEFIEEHF